MTARADAAIFDTLEYAVSAVRVRTSTVLSTATPFLCFVFVLSPRDPASLAAKIFQKEAGQVSTSWTLVPFCAGP
jgi:hypothetical protein